MTKTTSVVSILALTLSTAAFALSDSAQAMDANADGVLTIDEVQAAHPDITEASFIVMDLNADGALDASEVTAAEEAGMIPSSPTDS